MQKSRFGKANMKQLSRFQLQILKQEEKQTKKNNTMASRLYSLIMIWTEKCL